MRVALCISGQMRNIEMCYERFCKTIIEPTQPDIFVDTWRIAGESTNLRDSESNVYAKNVITEDMLKALYSPVKCNISDFKDEYYKQIETVRVPDELQEAVPRSKGTLPMYYKMYCCDKMRQEYEQQKGIVYDCVIRARPDMFLDRAIIIPNNKSETVWRLQPEQHSAYPSFTWDVFFLGNSKVMARICQLFSVLSDYWALDSHVWSQRASDIGAYNYWEHKKGSYLLSNHINRLGYAIETLPNKYFLEDKSRESMAPYDQSARAGKRNKFACLVRDKLIRKLGSLNGK